MRIDCATCPARNRACDDCMMQVLFDPFTSYFGPDDDAVELAAAVDVFVTTGLISDESARSALAGVDAGQSEFREPEAHWLHAV